MGNLTAYVPKLPSTSKAFDTACNQGTQAKIKRLMLQVWDEPDGLRELVDAIDASGSVHGSLAADNVLAAIYLQKLAAKTEGMEDIASLKIALVVRYMTAVLSQAGMSRAQRRAAAREAANAV